MIHFSGIIRRNAAANCIVILLLVFSVGSVAYLTYNREHVERAEQPSPEPETDYRALHLLALSHYTDYRTDEAIPLLERVRDHYVKHFGPDHPKTITVLSNLGATYGRAGRPWDAIALLEPVYANRNNTVGPNDRTMLSLSYNLAIAYKDLGRYADALQLIEQTLAIQRQTLGPDHPETMKSENARAWLEASSSTKSSAAPAATAVPRPKSWAWIEPRSGRMENRGRDQSVVGSECAARR